MTISTNILHCYEIANPKEHLAKVRVVLHLNYYICTRKTEMTYETYSQRLDYRDQAMVLPRIGNACHRNHLLALG